MKQPDSLDVGTKIDVVRHRLDYVQSEIFPRELGRKIVKAEEIRHASDYDNFYIASKEITEQQIETAAKILKLAEHYLFTEEKLQK